MFLFNKAGTISFQRKQVRYVEGSEIGFYQWKSTDSLKVNVYHSVIRGQVGKK
jgi:hypothetical protein